jgi:hypothetical protein
MGTKLNTNRSLRHHSAHPPSTVRPNLDINNKPNGIPTEQAAMPTPNPNPSLGPVGLDSVNSRKSTIDFGEDADTDENDCEEGDCEDDEDRLSPRKHAS